MGGSCKMRYIDSMISNSLSLLDDMARILKKYCIRLPIHHYIILCLFHILYSLKNGFSASLIASQSLYNSL